MDNPNLKEDILEHLQIQESLLQSYRGHFLTSQSLIVAIATLLVDPNKDDFMFGSLYLLGMTLILIWILVGRLKGMDVRYFQEELEKLQVDNAWKIYLSNRKQKRIKTRSIFEFWIPLIFAILWNVLAFKQLSIALFGAFLVGFIVVFAWLFCKYYWIANNEMSEKGNER